MSNIPDYLYHYTNLSSLSLILKNRSIRFNPLDKMDDMDESIISDFKSFAKYVFISSWTADSRESIPFWNMYTYNMTGVRIKLRALPFEVYHWTFSPESNAKDGGSHHYLPKELCENSNYMILSLPTENFIIPVQYTDDSDKLYPNILSRSGYHMKIATNNVGVYKRNEWSFQNEWRYRLNYFAGGIKELGTKNNTVLQKMIDGVDTLINHIDLKISSEFYNEIEIMTGPRMNNGDKELLKVICEKYCPSARIINSKLKIR